MTTQKIVLVTFTYDQGDILKDYIEWHLDLGVDLVIGRDHGSSDNTHEIIDFFAANGKVEWGAVPERNLVKFNENQFVRTVIDRHSPDWIIMCDADEFLCTEQRDLRSLLARAQQEDLTVISVPCVNMTGPYGSSTASATQTHTLRIDQPVRETHAQQLFGNLPVPYIFIQHPPKTITWASAFTAYEPGSHGAKTDRGKSGEIPELQFLHYPIRGFETFQTKVRNTEAYLRDNPHLQSWPEWGWHWRRWIRLNEQGLLREEYEGQFVSPERARELVRDGICTVDETVADWTKQKGSASGLRSQGV